MENLAPFQTNAFLFHNHVLEIASKSAEYQDIDRRRLDSLLIVADRILFACDQHPDLSRVAIEIPDRLKKVALSIENGNPVSRNVEDLLASIEKWLKAILWLIDLPRWMSLQGQSHFNFSSVVRELDLLNQTEIGLTLDTNHQISENCRRHILFAYRGRNFDVHETADLEYQFKSQFLPASIFTLIAPIHKHYNLLRGKLAALITRPLQASELYPVMRTIASEQRNHLAGFGGREKWLEDIRKNLTNLQQTGGYLLVTAHEGSGKSALCSKLIAELNQDMAQLGAHSDEVRRIAPWLPGVVVHFGKQAKQPFEVVRLLIDQINALISRPIALPEMPDYLLQPQMISRTGLPISAHISEYTPARSGKKLLTQFDPNIENYHSLREDYTTSEIFEIDTVPRTAKIETIDYARKLYRALDLAVQERGHIWVVIDALDEISPDGRSLNFLPEQLPAGTAILLTGRPGVIDKWVRHNRRNIRLRLKNLERNEVPLITGISDDAPGPIDFNDQLYQKSDGWALMIDHVAQRVRRFEGDYTQVGIENSVNDVLERQAQEWQKSDTLREISLLLAIFEPVVPLKLDFIQYYLEYKEIHLNKGQLRQVLQPVRTQLQGLDTDRIKLSLKTFAEYMRNIHCSERDLRRALTEVISWLSEDEDVDAKTLASFLQYWTDNKTILQSKIRNIAEKLVEAFVEQNNTKILYRIARSGWQKKNNPSFAIHCLQEAADLGSEKAMGFLGHCLIEGNGLEKNVKSGEIWIRKSAERKYGQAMTELGMRLINGDELDKNEEEGHIWLQRAAEANNDLAMFFLGVFEQDSIKKIKWLRQAAELDNKLATLLLSAKLLSDDEVVKNSQEGETWLRKLANANDPQGAHQLGSRLIQGQGLPQNVTEGEKWLHQAAGAGHPPAMYELGGRLIDGDKLEQNVEEGETWLRKAVEEEYEPAILNLANRLLDGDHLPQDPRQGRKYLEQLVKADSKRAMVNLGKRLLNGDNLPKDVKHGKKLLRRAADLGDPKAMFALSYMLLEGRNLPLNPNEGETWLRKAVEKDHTLAKGYLGVHLLDGKIIAQNKVEGENLLRQAVEVGDLQFTRILGIRLLAGDGVQQNKDEGEKFLRKAAESGDTAAMIRLAEELIDGDTFQQNKLEGEKWLLQAAEDEDSEAMGRLGERLLKGEGLLQDKFEGKKWLYKATELDNPRAMRVLGEILLDGEYLPPNPVEGKALLERAIQTNYVPAMVSLGTRLLDGQGLSKSQVQGLKWLRKATDQESLMAMAEMVRRYALGIGINKNINRAKRWLKKMKILSNKTDEVNYNRIIGVSSYLAKDYQLAATLFLQGYETKEKEFGINLAYMMRRDEIPSNIKVPPITEIFSSLFEDESPEIIGKINFALCLAAGFGYSRDWEKADDIIKNLDDVTSEWKWWKDVTLHQDSEGDLVIGWLVRHSHINDPDGLSIEKRFQKAVEGGWDVPLWMFEPVESSSSS